MRCTSGWRKTIWGFAATLLAATATARDNGCGHGASAIGNAYVRANPIYALYFGELAHFVVSNRAHFAPGSDAVRCADALARGLVAGAITSYDPRHFERQDALNAQLGSLGISPGPPQPSASAQLLTMARTFAWLARVLPAVSTGDSRPLYQANTEEERIAIFLKGLLAQLLQDPMVRAGLQEAEPQIREMAKLDYLMVVGWASQLAR